MSFLFTSGVVTAECVVVELPPCLFACLLCTLMGQVKQWMEILKFVLLFFVQMNILNIKHFPTILTQTSHFFLL